MPSGRGEMHWDVCPGMVTFTVTGDGEAADGEVVGLEVGTRAGWQPVGGTSCCTWRESEMAVCPVGGGGAPSLQPCCRGGFGGKCFWLRGRQVSPAHTGPWWFISVFFYNSAIRKRD